MSYIVTGLVSAPDIGFKSGTRHTAQGAKELARDFITDGMREVEVRDSYGALQSMRDLDEIVVERGDEEAAIDRRLRALLS